MPYARNQIDGTRIYFEDEGGHGVPVAFLGGLLDSVAVVRDAKLAGAVPSGKFRRVFIDHRGLGRSAKPHDPAAYAIALRVADVVAVLDALGVDRAHVVGLSWGGRLCFGRTTLGSGCAASSSASSGRSPPAVRSSAWPGAISGRCRAAARPTDHCARSRCRKRCARYDRSSDSASEFSSRWS